MDGTFYRIILSSLLLCAGLRADTLDDEFLQRVFATESVSTQEDFRTAHRHLDEVAGILEYLVQVCNKGGIKGPQAAKAKFWSIELQKTVKQLKLSDEFNADNALRKMAQSTRALVTHISNTIKSNFETIVPFELPALEEYRYQGPITQDAKFQGLDELQAMIAENTRLIKELHDESKTAGLTPFNRFIRGIDKFNEEWGITRGLDKLPRLIGIVGMGLYLMPWRWVANLPGVNYLKYWIGTPDYYDKEGVDAINHWYDLPQVPKNPAQALATAQAELQAAIRALPANQTASPAAMAQVNTAARAVNDAARALRPAAALDVAQQALNGIQVQQPQMDQIDAAVQAANQAAQALHSGTTQAQVESHKTLSGFLSSNDYKSAKHLGAMAMMIVAEDGINKLLAPVKQKFREWWNRLKGFDVPTGDAYKVPDITLEDPRLIGLENQIQEMYTIVNYIIEPEIYDRSASGLEKGILLTGPSRSGKTLLANALCGTLNEKLKEKGIMKKFAFKSIKYSEINWTAEGIKSVIQEAKQNAPCVLFIDELHNLPLQTKEGGQTLTEFLTMSETLASTEVGDAVILLAATNRPYMLDDALLKPGRFGKQIHFEEPSYEVRKKFFDVMFRENGISKSDFDIDALARQTEGCSYGDLDLVLKNARFTARLQRRPLTMAHITDKIYREVYRIRFDAQLPLTQQERKLVAAHQAGHALMYHLFENEVQERVEGVTIKGKWRKTVETRYFDVKAREEHLKAKKKARYGHVLLSHKSELVKIETSPVLTAKIKLAGAAAEQILLGSVSFSYHEKDKRKALDCFEKLAFNGLKKEDFSVEEVKEPMMRAKAELQKCEREVYELLMSHKDDLQKLATELERRELLTAADIKKILAKPVK